MSKKIKSAFDSVAKVATFGLADTKKLTDVFTLGGGGGLLDGITGQAAIDAAKAQAKTQETIAQQQATIAQNAAQLSAANAVDNSVNVIAGGTANAADSLGGDFKRKRTNSIASQLGV
ncbi:hypothetical protein C171_00440 [Pseudomonas phage YMC11/06/C171_PPU_BP]|uniref:Uncharacterized protein n=1 Tax=Pseudomonas phage YMC11/06/C171_PPU_BP TaxID=1777063 RepID=A0A127KP12_9CAUD|nr:virion structural protein [Pseudomonas phage YMC11/06/C171_PPU_BP]AMO43668.1 hypothetical protein C171_00440 [Pseudomonas phage YMC11/06/C171_PPU_BP]